MKQLIFSTFFIITQFNFLVYADSYIEKTMGGMSKPAKTWIQGLKSRTEMTIPFPNMPPVVLIQRADKGVQWSLNPKDQTYNETPMAMPYNPQMPIPAPVPLNNCEMVMQKISNQRDIAGFKATGYREGCKGNNQKQIHWFAPNSRQALQIKKESEAFDRALMNAQFANYPEKERSKAIASAERQKNNLVERLRGQQLTWPSALELALETEVDGKVVSSYVVSTLSTERIDNALFEIPAGYKKADPADLFRKLMEQQKKQPITK